MNESLETECSDCNQQDAASQLRGPIVNQRTDFKKVSKETHYMAEMNCELTKMTHKLTKYGCLDACHVKGKCVYLV